jgi:hypothetical protein
MVLKFSPMSKLLVPRSANNTVIPEGLGDDGAFYLCQGDLEIKGVSMLTKKIMSANEYGERQSGSKDLTSVLRACWPDRRNVTLC